jgi:hypothetical protein
MYADGIMDDTQKMLRTIINGQSAMKQELLTAVGKVEKRIDKLDDKVDGLDARLTEVETNLTSRLDKVGLKLARLEDDAPTREEFENLESRVVNLEQSTASV